MKVKDEMVYIGAGIAVFIDRMERFWEENQGIVYAWQSYSFMTSFKSLCV